MAKTTTVTTSYTSNIVVNGTAVSADKIYANGTQVRRCIVNGTDVIHKFTRTVVTAKSDLTFNFKVYFTVRIQSGYKYYFNSPINVIVTVTDNGSSGFTQVTVPTITLTFYCAGGTQGLSPDRYYMKSFHDIDFSIGQEKQLKFDSFTGLLITTSQLDGPHYTLDMDVTDPDGVSTTLSVSANYKFGTSYSFNTTQQRTINRTLSDNTVQEY